MSWNPLTSVWGATAFGLAAAVAGDTVGIIGGSQFGGSNTGQYGTRDDPYNVIPDTITVIKNGAVVTAWLAVEGILPGVVVALARGRPGKRITVVAEFVDASKSDDWTATHLATFAGHLATFAPTARLGGIAYVGAKNDCGTLAQANGFPDSLRALQSAIDTRWPNIGTVLCPIVATDPTILGQDQARVTLIEHARDRQGRRGLIDYRNIPLQLDLQHSTAVGFDLLGERVGAAFLSGHCLR